MSRKPLGGPADTLTAICATLVQDMNDVRTWKREIDESMEVLKEMLDERGEGFESIREVQREQTKKIMVIESGLPPWREKIAANERRISNTEVSLDKLTKLVSDLTGYRLSSEGAFADHDRRLTNHFRELQRLSHGLDEAKQEAQDALRTAVNLDFPLDSVINQLLRDVRKLKHDLQLLAAATNVEFKEFDTARDHVQDMAQVVQKQAQRPFDASGGAGRPPQPENPATVLSGAPMCQCPEPPDVDHPLDKDVFHVQWPYGNAARRHTTLCTYCHDVCLVRAEIRHQQDKMDILRKKLQDNRRTHQSGAAGHAG